MTAADGTLVVSGEIAVISFERRLGHPIEDVWAALTDPEEFAAWLGPGTLEPRQGGQVSIRTGPADQPGRQRTMSGRVLACDPPRLLEHEWIQPGLDGSVVRYELQSDAGGTILRMTHRRSVMPGAFGGRAGWHAYLDRLAAHLDGQPVPAWAERRAEVQDAYGEAPLPGA
ncbi:MAG: SRPBCC family protein [Chloroflexi bacterium]|nr:SRPBCC family protein [Chloroflexota bacterium]